MAGYFSRLTAPPAKLPDDLAAKLAAADADAGESQPDPDREEDPYPWWKHL